MVAAPETVSSMTPASPGRRRDVRLRVAFLALLFILGLGYGLMRFGTGAGTDTGPQAKPTRDGPASPHPPGFSGLKAAPGQRGEVSELEYQEPARPVGDAADRQARAVLRAGGKLIKTRQYDEAIAMLTRQQPLLKDYAEAYLLLGRALEGRRDYEMARDFYNAAVDRAPYMPDAYWGFATTSEKLNDVESALAGMRSFLHVEGGEDPYRLRVAQARAAIWEWESTLGRGPWGPTKGVPPGFTAAEIRRDDRGVGIKMQVGGTENPAGETKAEMKHQEKFKLYSR